MVSCLIFKYFRHLDFLSVYSVRVCSNITDLHVTVQLWTGRPGVLQFMGLQRVGHD